MESTITYNIMATLMVSVQYGLGKDLIGLSMLKGSEERQREFNQTYPGCWLGNYFYMVGDKWSPKLEPYGVMDCVKCQCAQIVKRNVVQLEGKVLCRNIKRDCPKVNCRAPRLRPNTCCKICDDQDTHFEDQFSNANIGVVPTVSPHTTNNKKGMNALLTGSIKHSNQPIRTRAVSLLRIDQITGSSFQYHIRFSRLKNLLALRFLEKSGGILIEVKLSVEVKRKGKIRGTIGSIPYTTMDALLSGTVWCSITTLRHKDGEISGPLLIDDISTPALFEALLSPTRKNGFGGHMTMFYDSGTFQASYIIQLQHQGSIATESEFFVTIEKDTDVIYQHLLRRSPKDNKLIGRLKLEKRMSKQLARGRLYGRVTSRSGETIAGVLRPRLVRSDVMSLFSLEAENITGYMVGRIQESGTFTYKVSVDVLDGRDKSIHSVSIQRHEENRGKWKTFATFTNWQWTKQSGYDTFTITGEYKKLKMKDVAAILDGKTRLRFRTDDVFCYSQFERYSLNNVDLLKDSSVIIHNPYCDGTIIVWYKMTADCTLHIAVKYIEVRYRRTNTLKLAATLKNGFDAIYGEEMRELRFTMDKPEANLVNLSDAMLRDLNAGGAYLQLHVESNPCDKWLKTIANDCWRNTNSEDDVTSQTSLNELEKEGDRALMYTCHHEGKFYPHGDSWVPQRSDACVTCRCERGTVYCDDVLCPPTNCALPVKRKGECCSVCEENNETERKPVGSCFYQGDKRWHSFGTFWHPYVPPFGYSKCSICTCVAQTGEVNCSRLACPPLECPVYMRARIKRDDCCQVCQGQYANGLVPIPTQRYSSDDCQFGATRYTHGDKWHPVLTPFGKMTCYICSCKNGKIRCRKKKCPLLKCKRQYRPAGKCCPVCKGRNRMRQRNKRKRLVART